MTGILLGITSILYLGTGIAYVYQGNPGMAVAFLAYSVANMGLYFGAK